MRYFLDRTLEGYRMTREEEERAQRELKSKIPNLDKLIEEMRERDAATVISGSDERREEKKPPGLMK